MSTLVSASLHPIPATGAAPAAGSGRPLTLAEVRRRHILHVLALCRGNRSQAARLLGIGRTSLYRFLLGENSRGAQAGATSAAGGSSGGDALGFL